MIIKNAQYALRFPSNPGDTKPTPVGSANPADTTPLTILSAAAGGRRVSPVPQTHRSDHEQTRRRHRQRHNADVLTVKSPRSATIPSNG